MYTFSQAYILKVIINWYPCEQINFIPNIDDLRGEDSFRVAFRLSDVGLLGFGLGADWAVVDWAVVDWPVVDWPVVDWLVVDGLVDWFVVDWLVVDWLVGAVVSRVRIIEFLFLLSMLFLLSLFIMFEELETEVDITGVTLDTGATLDLIWDGRGTESCEFESIFVDNKVGRDGGVTTAELELTRDWSDELEGVDEQQQSSSVLLLVVEGVFWVTVTLLESLLV